MAISSTARMLSNAPINIVHPYIFNVNIHFTVSHCSAGDSTTGIPFGHHSAALLGMTYFLHRKQLDKSKFEKRKVEHNQDAYIDRQGP